MTHRASDAKIAQIAERVGRIVDGALEYLFWCYLGVDVEAMWQNNWHKTNR